MADDKGEMLSVQPKTAVSVTAANLYDQLVANRELDFAEEILRNRYGDAVVKVRVEIATE